MSKQKGFQGNLGDRERDVSGAIQDYVVFANCDVKLPCLVFALVICHCWTAENDSPELRVHLSLFLRVAHLLIPQCSLNNKKLETRLYNAGLFLPKDLQNLPNL